MNDLKTKTKRSSINTNENIQQILAKKNQNNHNYIWVLATHFHMPYVCTYEYLCMYFTCKCNTGCSNHVNMALKIFGEKKFSQQIVATNIMS